MPPLRAMGAMLPAPRMFEDPPRTSILGKEANSGRAAMSFLAMMLVVLKGTDSEEGASSGAVSARRGDGDRLASIVMAVSVAEMPPGLMTVLEAAGTERKGERLRKDGTETPVVLAVVVDDCGTREACVVNIRTIKKTLDLG